MSTAEDDFAAATQAHVAGDVDAAMAAYRRLLRAQPRTATLLRLLGAGHGQAGRHELAAAFLRTALAIVPDDAEAHCNLGSVFARQGAFEAAMRSFVAALCCDPGHLVAARQLCQAAADLAARGGVPADLPGPAAARVTLAVALLGAGRPEAALDELQQAVEAEPTLAAAHYNRGCALARLDRPEAAAEAFRAAIRLAPGDAAAHVNLASRLKELGRLDAAEAALTTALALQPDYPLARLHLAILLLLRGRFDLGWPAYEARWQVVPATQRRDLAAPPWTGGEALAGRRILLHAEQGHGDTLHFVRYVPLVEARGAEVVLEVQPALARLLRDGPGTATVIVRGEALPEVDFQLPLLSLPRVFGTTVETVPAAVPYLQVPADRRAAWAGRIAPGGRKVGLAWSGNPAHHDDRRRSLPPHLLAPLLALPGIDFHLLQRDLRPAERELLASCPQLADHSSDLADFADTAALVAGMDLVISADTAVAHLAGGLARPLWLLLPQPPDWRWLTGRDDSPWYPTARLFRQRRFGDWAEPVERLCQALAEWRDGR